MGVPLVSSSLISCFFSRYIIPAVLLLSVVITIVLLFYPRQSPGEAMDTGQEVRERETEGGRDMQRVGKSLRERERERD